MADGTGGQAESAGGQAGSVILLPVHPRYADLIASGEKRVEFRRCNFARNITSVVIYSTSPDQKVVGVCEVEQVIRSTPSALWKEHGKVAGITREALFGYLKGVRDATAIVLRNFHWFVPDLRLPMLGIERAPQSFQYLRPSAVAVLDRHKGQEASW